MIEMNPITLAGVVEDNIRRYLKSALPINRNYPRLRGAIETLLNQKGQLLKGPYVEALPDFQKSTSLQSLTIGETPLLTKQFAELPENEFTRPLHRHQAEALQAVIGERKNVVVATGTGSGKTECFLYPILDSLLGETAEQRQRPGVRALLVYPLNALANDQLYKRIVPLFVGRFASAGIKVGRFTGLTRDDVSRENAEQDVLTSDPSFRELFGTTIPSNWQLTRQEMLGHPPHILITNYAMLEHLLLFPKNAALFLQATLRFLVLDEVHTYSGAQASEVALLLRKLRRRLGLSSEDIRCIGTSASLAEGERAEKDICCFASDLFGASFTRVIRGKRQKHSLLSCQSSDTFSLPANAWTTFGQILSKRDSSEEQLVQTWNLALNDLDLSEVEKSALTLDDTESFESALARIFAKVREMRLASDALSDVGPMPFSELAKLVFKSESVESESALAGLIGIGIRARMNPEEFSLLPARYHFFTNGIDNLTGSPGSEQGRFFQCTAWEPFC
jgi:ATP-dependent helicase YprA (DUF1998 family)